LSSVRHLENAKFEAQKKMYEFVRTQRVAPQMINAVIKVEKLKADDHFFNETGIEEEDVEPSIKRLELEEDQEFKDIIEEYKKKSDEFLASKKRRDRPNDVKSPSCQSCYGSKESRQESSEEQKGRGKERRERRRSRRR